MWDLLTIGLLIIALSIHFPLDSQVCPESSRRWAETAFVANILMGVGVWIGTHSTKKQQCNMLMKIALCILSTILLNKDKILLKIKLNLFCWKWCLFNHLRRELCQNKGKIFAFLEANNHNISEVGMFILFLSMYVVLNYRSERGIPGDYFQHYFQRRNVTSALASSYFFAKSLHGRDKSY